MNGMCFYLENGCFSIWLPTMGVGNPQYGQILDDAIIHPLYEEGCPLVIIYTQL